MIAMVNATSDMIILGFIVRYSNDGVKSSYSAWVFALLVRTKEVMRDLEMWDKWMYKAHAFSIYEITKNINYSVGGFNRRSEKG